MVDPVGIGISVGTAVSKGVAGTVTHECIKEHREDIRKGINHVKNEVDKGWQRDCEAGGVTSWRNKQTEVEPA